MKLTVHKLLLLHTLAAAFLLLSTHLGHCYYNASTGRWLSRDPIGEKAGPNLYGFVKNSPVDRTDYLGLADPWPGYPGGPWGPGVSCPCRCIDVDVTYEPGGDTLRLGPYTTYLFYFGKMGISADNHVFGNQVHVTWHVAGNPGGCRYYQDEEGSSILVARIAPTPFEKEVKGVHGNEVLQKYTDYMGPRFGLYPAPFNDLAGEYSISLNWIVTFRCESQPGSGGTTKTKTDVFARSAAFKVPWW